MKLFEHPDFDQALIAARRHFNRPGLTEQLIEKDYYVTGALRITAKFLPGKTLFKGGTSLSKGWNLIQRFSEDIDLFVNPAAYDPALGKKGIDRELKRLRDEVNGHPGLNWLAEEGQTIGGFGRSDRFAYQSKFDGFLGIAPRILLEVGTSSGTEPCENRAIMSYVAEFLRATNQSMGAEDEAPFVMPLLHFRRTFVEKLFTIHAKVEIFKATGKEIGSYARHYYDLACLADQSDVIAMLQSAEYEDIKADYERISLSAFARDYRPPTGLSFKNSDAIYPPASLAVALRADYERQCAMLCFDDYPSWNEVMGRFASLRDRL